MYKQSIKGWLKHWDFILLDGLCLILGLLCAFVVRSRWFTFNESNILGLISLIMAINLFVVVSSKCFEHVKYRGYLIELREVLKQGFELTALVSLAMEIRSDPTVQEKLTILLGILFYAGFTFAFRTVWKIILKKYPQTANRQALLVITNEKHAEEVVERIRNYAASQYSVEGLVFYDRDAKGETVDGVPVVANLDDAADYICRNWIDDVFFFHSSLEDSVQELISKCKEMCVTMHFYFSLQNLEERKQSFGKIAGYDVIAANVNIMPFHDVVLKRLFDICAGIIGSVIAVIAMIVLAPVILTKSPGPLIYVQERIGENGRRFKVYKIRSMYTDADARKEEFAKKNSHADAMMYKLEFDPRVIGNVVLPDGTRKRGIGDFIRKTHIDELPQFFNVLKGDMSVVGTRPPTLDEWEKYSYKHRSRMSIKPGLTGFWQIDDRKDTMSFDEIVALDTEYIASWSFGLDMKIILETVKKIIELALGKEG